MKLQFGDFRNLKSAITILGSLNYNIIKLLQFVRLKLGKYLNSETTENVKMAIFDQIC